MNDTVEHSKEWLAGYDQGCSDGAENARAQAFEEAAKMCDDRGFEILAEKLRALAQAKVTKSSLREGAK